MKNSFEYEAELSALREELAQVKKTIILTIALCLLINRAKNQ